MTDNQIHPDFPPITNISIMSDQEMQEMQLQDIQYDIAVIQDNNNDFFLLTMATIIFFMQPGFAFLEAGSVRAKNTTNILLKNLLDVCIGAISYYAFGYAFAFGTPGNLFISYGNFFFNDLDPSLLSHFFFHFVFAATASTIVSGAMAERTEFLAYVFYSVFITGFIYPVVSHWAWYPTGWLASGPGNPDVTYLDFAGSSVVHMVGGTAALMGALIVGPRMGRFNSDGSSNTIQGHTVPMVALGGFILFFGFFAFNGGSQASISQPGDGFVVANAIVNTILSGSMAALITLFTCRLLYGTKKWSLLLTINGGLTGMVAICAGCNALYAWGAVATGAVAGLVFIVCSYLVEKSRIDDPIDAVAVHLGGGLWGILSAPLFTMNTGVFFTWSSTAFVQWGWNAVGACAVIVWVGLLSGLLFGFLRVFGVLRASKELEEAGMDIMKHGEPAYPIASYINSGGPFAGYTNGVQTAENGLGPNPLDDVKANGDDGPTIMTDIQISYENDAFDDKSIDSIDDDKKN